jgi:translation initiation factor 2 subunit 2
VDKLTEKTECLDVSDGEEVLNDENVDFWDDIDGKDEEGEGIVVMRYPWERTDRDYEYEEVCFTAHSIIMIIMDVLHPSRH